jgi:hypothetical protein
MHENRRLFDLAQANQQRLRLAQLRRESSPSVCALWDSKPLSFHPATPPVVPEAYAWCAALHKQSAGAPNNTTRILRTSSPERVYAWLLAESLVLPTLEYVASFGGGDQFSFESGTQWIPRFPVTRVTAAELGAVLQAERRLPFEELVLVATSGSAKLVLDSFVGVLEEEPHAGEAIYELASTRGAA